MIFLTNNPSVFFVADFRIIVFVNINEKLNLNSTYPKSIMSNTSFPVQDVWKVYISGNWYEFSM